MSGVDVISGEDAVKAAGALYLPRLDSQTDEEYAAYKERASFFNATARTAEGYVGLIFRRPPFIKIPEGKSALGLALSEFVNDSDMLGTPLISYAKNVVNEVISVGRAGTLIDWEDEVENRVYACFYPAENILNWRVERINGRNIPTMIVLYEPSGSHSSPRDSDPFVTVTREQIRVLRLVPGEKLPDVRKQPISCVVEIWQRDDKKSRRDKNDWKLVETRIPLRLGRPLPLLPFIFHGPRHSQPSVDRLPLGDIITVNLDHYRLDADYKHGIHFTALPTAWVSGFDKSANLRIGSSTAWVTETTGATAGYLEFTGHGLITFERAMDRDERLLAVLGSRIKNSSNSIYEFTETGTWLRTITTSGFADCEGICWMYDDKFGISEEDTSSIVIVTIAPGTSSITKGVGTTTVDTGLGNLDASTGGGFEGLTYDAENHLFYVGKERRSSAPTYQGMAVYRVRMNGSWEIIFDAPAKLGAVGLATDLADLFYDAHSRHLFLLSQESERIIETDLSGTVFRTSALPGPMTQAEGLTFSPDRSTLWVVGEPNEMRRFTVF